MTEERKLDINGLIKEDAQRKREKRQQLKEITLREYLDLVVADPSICQNARSRLLESVLSYGVEEISDTESSRLLLSKDIKRRYKLFSGIIFGLEEVIDQIINFWKAGAANLPIGKKILLLVGPPGSSKSTIADCCKKSLIERRTPVYAIKGCPIREEPLHLLPKKVAEEFTRNLGIRIKGDLCPHCQDRLKKDFRDEDGAIRWADVPVETFEFSERAARGIASYEPSDDKSSSVVDLTGEPNMAIISARGPDDPFAYSLNGEICKSNRGLFEGVELIKNDEKVLWLFISLAQEQRVKVTGSGFPPVHIDTNIIGHTNLNEYTRFSNNKANEALHGRIYVIYVPYVLEVSEEVKIYRKLIEEESDFAELMKCHIAPGALEIAAMFAVLTRYTDKNSQQIPNLLKMKLYNGEHALWEVEGKETMSIDVGALRKEGKSNSDISKREGMFGVSPRDVLDAVNISLARQQGGCLTPLTVLRALRDFTDHKMGYSPEEKERFKLLLSAKDGDGVVNIYNEFVSNMVGRAFLEAYRDLARELFRRYIKEAELERSKKRKFLGQHLVEAERDPRTGEPREPDVKLLRSIEQFIPIDESMAPTFRGEILEVKASHPDFSYDTYRPLAKAVEKKLLYDNKETMTLVLAHDKLPSEEVKKRSHDLRSALEDQGHCDICSKELMEEAAKLLKE